MKVKVGMVLFLLGGMLVCGQSLEAKMFLSQPDSVAPDLAANAKKTILAKAPTRQPMPVKTDISPPVVRSPTFTETVSLDPIVTGSD